MTSGDDQLSPFLTMLREQGQTSPWRRCSHGQTSSCAHQFGGDGSTLWPFARRSSDTSRVHDTLLHREALLVVSTGDSEDVSLELVADGVSGDLVAHTAVHEDAELALIFNLDQLLGAVGRE